MTDTPWRMNADGDWSRTYRGFRLEVMQDGDLSWSWQAWGAGEYEPEMDGESSSEMLAKLAADCHVECATHHGPATEATALLSDADVSS